MAKRRKTIPKPRSFLPVVVIEGREIDLKKLTMQQREWLKKRREKVAKWIKL